MKMPRRSGASFEVADLGGSQPGELKGYRDLDPAVTGRKIRLTTRLTDLTLHHLASLDQTEEGPVRQWRPGGAFSFGAGMGVDVSHQPP